MAEKHEIVELGNSNRDGNDAVYLTESSSASRRNRLVASMKALFGPNKKGAVRPPESLERSGASSSSVCSSARIERMMQSRTEFATALDREIEASKDHWSELEPPRSEELSSDAEEESVHLTNGEIVESLRKQYPKRSSFFWDCAGNVEVGEKLAEGAQAEIFTAKFIGDSAYDMVLKVFKEGSLVRDLQKQWPLGLMKHCGKMGIIDTSYICSSLINSGTVVMNGRFAFMMGRCWGDLRKLLDKRMELTGNQCPPLPDRELGWNMYEIARGMKSLHEGNIIHRDLKASNVLLWTPSKYHQGENSNGDFAPYSYFCKVADYECSVGVVGTGFWRAPEILQGVKDRKITPDLFTKKSDVYSFAMTCYEMVSGEIPFEGLLLNDYDVVLQGERPILPEGTKPWVKELLSRCWHHNPSERPNFVDIYKHVKSHRLYQRK